MEGNLEPVVRLLCRQKGIRMAELAQRVGMTQSNLVASLRKNPKLGTIYDICSALRISPSDLFGGETKNHAGIVLLDGQTYILNRPSSNALQIPMYNDSSLKDAIGTFVLNALKSGQSGCITGMLDTSIIFSVIYDNEVASFSLVTCRSDNEHNLSKYPVARYSGDDSAFRHCEDIAEDIMIYAGTPQGVEHFNTYTLMAGGISASDE